MIKNRHSQLKSDIINNRKIFFKVIAIFFSLLIILSLSGATCDDNGGTIQNLLFGDEKDPTNLGSDPTKITTDISQMRNNVTLMIWNVVGWLTGFAAVIGTIYFILSGYFYMTALGDKEKIDKAKKGMLWSVIGIFILLICVVTIKFAFNDVLKLNVKI